MTQNTHMNGEHVEEWRSIRGSNYELSDLGRLRNTSHYGKARLIDMTQRKSSNDVTIQIAGKPIYIRLAREVLTLFVGPPPMSAVAVHLNGDSKDNRLANLKWGNLVEARATVRLHNLAVAREKRAEARKRASAAVALAQPESSGLFRRIARFVFAPVSTRLPGR